MQLIIQPGASRKEALSILCPYVLVTSTFTVQETYTHTPPHPPVLHANGSRERALPAEVQQHDRTFWTAKRNALAPVSSTHGARPHPSSTCLLQQLSQPRT